jgi:hypothetical protein
VTVTVTIRPGARTQIRGLPWTGSPADNYAILEECIGASRRGQVLYENGGWTVARSHTQVLVAGLAMRFGVVHVIQYGGIEKCVEACWNAKPETAPLCECSCAGANHGTRQPLGMIVSEDGPSGALSVASTGPREYDVHAKG